MLVRYKQSYYSAVEKTLNFSLLDWPTNYHSLLMNFKKKKKPPPRFDEILMSSGQIIKEKFERKKLDMTKATTFKNGAED